MGGQSKSASKASKAVDRLLQHYRSMRDFHETSEPQGGSRSRFTPLTAGALPFVVQKHAATRLHYDFRLGWQGVLKSWAVTKGPSNNPADKRLAVQVEDHPIEYGGFEGIIPEGQYGGGTVMVWDTGTWEPVGDADQGFRDGNLKFDLHGKKLKGKWALIRMHGRMERADKPNWLLIKEHDSFATNGSIPAITDHAPDSVITHRSIEQIASNQDHVWNSTGTPIAPVNGSRSTPTAASPAVKTTAETGDEDDSLLASAPREAFPRFIAPQLAQPSTKAPNGEDWIHELKLDGYRIQIHVLPATRATGKQRSATLLTRKGLDWTNRMPDIASAASQLPVHSAILDGEVVSLNKDGVSSFADLQAAFQEGRQADLIYFAFDLLHLNGHNLRSLPLLQRKQLLDGVLGSAGGTSPLRLGEHLQASGDEVFRNACALGAEGVISKLASSKYTSGRSNTWIKAKCVQEQEFVIGGYTLPSKGGSGIGALLLGYGEGGTLRYAGRTGTGFTQTIHHSLRGQLDKLVQKKMPFADAPASMKRNAIWVRPKLVAQVAFSTWTRDNLVRQAAFKGLREDKPANEVVRETADSFDMPESTQVTKRSSASSRRSSRPLPISTEKTAQKTATLPITHPDKVLDQESGMTKQMLAEYYLTVSEQMLPHVADRPLSVVRCPEGTSKPCFFQKHIGSGMPKGVSSIPIKNPKTGESEDYLTLNTAEGLVGMAQMGVLEIHAWGSRNESLDKPDRIVFDLDPDAAIEWRTLAASAEELRARLEQLGLVSFLKSTGGKGLHLVVPIRPEREWSAIKQFAYAVVLRMEKENPGLYLTKMAKAARKNRIYLDYLRNDREATSIAPFSPRARAGIPVAVPLQWKELKSPRQPLFQVSELNTWRARLLQDPWKDINATRQRLSTTNLRDAGAVTIA